MFSCAEFGLNRFFFFSFDVRGRLFGQAKLWSSPAGFGPRAFFRASASPAHLLLDDVRASDAGIYRCRVDFKNSPTRNLKVNFTVLSEYNWIYFIFTMKSRTLRNVEFNSTNPRRTNIQQWLDEIIRFKASYRTKFACKSVQIRCKNTSKPR